MELNKKSFCAIQSSFMPWIGYFSMIRASNTFVLIDDVQYDKNGWRNRNRIKGRNSAIWLTVPVLTSKRSGQLISAVEIDYSTKWEETLLGKIRESYKDAKFFSVIYPMIVDSLKPQDMSLNELNLKLITEFMNVLRMNQIVVMSSTLNASQERISRLIDYSELTQCEQYISGPMAKNYIDEKRFREHGLHLRWYEYNELLEYSQLGGDFLPKLSIVDLLMNLGPEEAIQFIDRINESWEQQCKE